MCFHKPILIFCLLLPAILPAQTTPAADSLNVRFEKVESEASFPGGLHGWRAYLITKLNPNIPVDNGAPSGKYTVIVQFVVSKDGAVSNIKALTDLGYGMEEEVVRIIERSGNWKPALQNGRPVNAYRKQPVTFVVEDDGFQITSKEPYTLFAGIDNEITVSAGKISNSNLTLTISKGNITPAADGRFIVKVHSPGRVLITIYNKKTEKQIGAASYEVKNP
ncbi:MAG TPA: energy transducer TonB [Ferruginibacter sp.]|nr:energy transducer TonB [Ferruginibacter sp.]